MAASSPFSIPAFRAYFVARLATTVANNAMVVVIGWQVYDIARRTMLPKDAAFQLGIIGIIQFLPLLLLTLVTGWVADRFDRRLVARLSLLIEIGCSITLAILTARGTTTLAALFIVAAFLGIARAFSQPAMTAVTPRLVPPELLPRAIASSSIAWQIGAITGPALGGYLYAWHADFPYGISAVLFSVTFLAMGFLPKMTSASLGSASSAWHQMVDGLRYVRQNRLVLGAISLDLFAVLLGGATAMLPIYARDILHGGSEGLGHLRAAPAVGAAITAIWFSFYPLKHDVGLKLLIAVGVFGLATILFGLSRSMPISLMCLALLGAADMFSVFVRQSLVQIYTPDEMRGRVGAVSTLFISGSNELGEAESGLLASLIGPVAAVVAGGVGSILITILWSRWFPELRNARTFDVPDQKSDKNLQETVV